MKAWVERGANYSRKGLERFQNLKHGDVKRILVIRHAALGDMIQARPFLVELKKLFPNSNITLSVISTFKTGAPIDLVDSTHVLDKSRKSPFYIRSSIKELGDFDIVFDLADTSRSHLITFFSKSRLKLGFSYRKMSWLYDLSLLRSDFQYEADLTLDFLSLFGHRSEYPLNFKLPHFSKENASKSIAFFLSSSNPDKNYPEQKYKAVIEQLSQNLPDYNLYIVQGNGEHEKFENLYEELRNLSNVKLKEFSPLDSLIKWTSELSVLVSNDTGVRHIALGTHTPTVGLFNSTVPYRQWPRYEHVHECLFNLDGSYPNEGEVVQAITKLL